MATVDVRAYGFSTTFNLRELVSCFAAGSAQIEKDELIATLGPQAWAIGYDFGALVFVGVEAAQRAEVIARLVSRFRSEPHAPLEESFLIEAGGSGSEVRFDRVVLPELTLPVAKIVSEILAQSVAMDYYAGDVLEIEAQTDRITEELRVRGRVPLGTKQLTQFIGLCIATRNDIISTLALFDKPEATWESEQLDKLWSGLHQMLELNDRYRALEAKLRIFQDNVEVLVDLTHQNQTFRLELVVVLLIVLELAVAVGQWLRP